jgi:hypothetical protein
MFDLLLFKTIYQRYVGYYPNPDEKIETMLADSLIKREIYRKLSLEQADYFLASYNHLV